MSLKIETQSLIKTYILQFIYEKGNGWAFINAYNITQAQSIFRVQTQYKGAKMISIKETKYYGNNVQLVYEGAVTTVSVSGTKPIPFDEDAVKTIIEDKLKVYYTKREVTNLIKNIDFSLYLKDYYTKEEIDNKLKNTSPSTTVVIPSIDAETKCWMIGEESTGVIAEGKDGKDGKNGENGKNGKDGLTPTINPFNKHWIIGNEDTGVIAEGRNGTDGQSGVGIANIQCLTTQVSGGINRITITLTNGESYSFNVRNGVDGQTTSLAPGISHLESTEFGIGTFNEAWNKAKNTPASMFQWILNDTDDNGNEYSKVIWHLGNNKFIDTLGAPILGRIDGVTLVCKTPCTWVTYATGVGKKDTELSAGINNFSFEELQQMGVITDSNNPSLIATGFAKIVDNSRSYCYDSIELIDFGGMTITSTSGIPAYSISILLNNQINLKSIDRLVLNISNSSAPVELCGNCSRLLYANISGNVVCSQASLFNRCPNLRKINISDLYVSTNNLSGSFNGTYEPNGGFPLYQGSLLELDIRNFNSDGFTSLSTFLGGQSKLRKLIIGDFNTSNSTNAGFTGVSNCILICTSLAPPTIPASTSSNAWINKTRFSAIYVPDSALDEYRNAWSDYADIIFSINTYVDIYNE